MTLKFNIKHFFISVTVLTLLSTSSIIAEEFEAVLGWSKRVELSSPVSGLVQKVFAQPGKIAAKGEILIQLDPRIFKAKLKSAKANVTDLDEKSQEAKRELDRQADMYDRSMLSEHDLQVAKNNLVSAQAQFYQAESALVKAKVNLEYSAVRAPFNAIVISTSAIKGQVVAAEISPPVLTTVAEADRMLARFYAADTKLDDLSLNQAVKVTIAGRMYQGKISNIALETEHSNGYAVDVIFDSKKIMLRAGQKARVSL